jgi:ABC-type multidrug transport system permease subunit
MLANLWRIAYLELIFSLRIPASVMYVVLLPMMLMLLFGGRYSDVGALVMGLTAMVAGVSTLQGVGQVTAGMRHGIWRTIRIAIDPDWLYLAGLVFSRALRSVVVACVLLIGAYVAFGYVLKGNLALHLGIILVGSIPFAFLGLLFAYLPRTPMTGSMLLNLFILGMLAVSGVFAQPSGWLTYVSYASPLTYLVALLRDNGDPTSRHHMSAWLSTTVLVGWALAAASATVLLARAREDD